jgi:alpha-beta hydrolase superfamily lysophospholipase
VAVAKAWRKWEGGALEFIPGPRGQKLALRRYPGPEGAPAVLCLHGMGNSGAQFVPLAEALRDTHRVFALDFPGCGDSEGERGVLKVTRYLRAVDSALKTCGPNAHLVGHSLGALIALRWASLRDRGPLRKLVLIAPALKSTRPPELSLVARVFFGLVLAPRRRIRVIPSAGGPVQAYAEYARTDKTQVADWTPSSLTAILMLQAGATRDARTVLAPTLVLHGEKDQVAHPEGARQLYAALGSHQKDLRIFSDADHFLWDAFSNIDTGLYRDADRARATEPVRAWLLR